METKLCSFKIMSNNDSDSDYHPSSDEEFMCDEQIHYFKKKLVSWRNQLLKESEETIQLMQENEAEPDAVDAASNEVTRTNELRTRDRERKLVKKIDAALRRIEEGTYGYCEETGEPISIKRLDARPIATLCIEAQERHEKKEKSHRD